MSMKHELVIDIGCTNMMGISKFENMFKNIYVRFNLYSSLDYAYFNDDTYNKIFSCIILGISYYSVVL